VVTANDHLSGSGERISDTFFAGAISTLMVERVMIA